MKIYIIGFFFISIIGTLLHFTYDLTKHNKVVGLFSAVNESTWEHIKMGLTPYFAWSLVDGFIYGINPNYFFSKLVGLIAIIIIIPLIFYSYKLITKKSILIIDILTFYIAIFCSQYFGYLLINIKKVPYYLNYISLVLLFIIFGMFMVATIMPIKTFIFKDPITNKYGLRGHNHE